MEAASKDEALTKPKRCFGSLVLGASLAAIAGVAVVVDFRNNTEFGAKISPELGMVMGLAAVALVALPAAAAALGRWDWRLTSGTIFAGILTVLAAVSAYADKQGQEILARQAAANAYRTAQENAGAARHEIAEARAVAEGIAETASVSDLEAMAKLQRELIDKETKDRGGCGKKCREAEAELKAVVDRIPAARAKQEAFARGQAAQARLDKAQTAQASGPAEQTLLASFIAARVSRAAEDVAKDLALITTSLSIAVTLVLALLAEQAVLLLKKGIGLGSNVADADGHPMAPRRKAVKAADRARLQSLSDDELLAKFAEDARARGRDFTGGELYDEFGKFWLDHASGRRTPSQVVLSKALLSAGFNRERRGGRTWYETRKAT
jgi:hypothetical protein